MLSAVDTIFLTPEIGIERKIPLLIFNLESLMSLTICQWPWIRPWPWFLTSFKDQLNIFERNRIFLTAKSEELKISQSSFECLCQRFTFTARFMISAPKKPLMQISKSIQEPCIVKYFSVQISYRWIISYYCYFFEKFNKLSRTKFKVDFNESLQNRIQKWNKPNFKEWRIFLNLVVLR